MSFIKSIINGLPVFTETKALPNATLGYSGVLKGVIPNPEKNDRNITIVCHPTAITGTNLDIALYGSKTEAGTTKYLLKDAVVADLTADDTAVAGVVDLNDYPAPYYFIGITSDADETANSMTIDVFG